MNYRESRAYIEDAQKYGSVLGLDNMLEMLARLGNPQDSLSYVHVAGTNGKGSVLACLASVLTGAGYKVGRYTSPTIYSYRERMDIGGEPISQEKFARHLTKVAEAIEQMTEDGLPHPTPFEIETAVMFSYFQEEQCQLVLLETGMGGSLDATNIVKNTKVAILTAISMDHMGFLGNSLYEIAGNKAGIIKPGAVVVTAPQKPEALKAIKEACHKNQVTCIQADPENVSQRESSYLGQNFLYKNTKYEISLAGLYQIENAVVAIRALQELSAMGYPLSSTQIQKGLATTVWGGRFTVLRQNPLFIVDGAHNIGAAETLAATVKEYFPDKKLIYIMGMFADKEYEKVIKTMIPYGKAVYTVETPDNDRALPSVKLAETVSRYQPNVHACTSLQDGYEQAMAAAAEDVILAFGSLSYLGEMTRIVMAGKEK